MVTVKEIAFDLKVSVETVYKHIHLRKVMPSKIVSGVSFYNKWRELVIKKSVSKIIEVVKYYPIKTTETFYIYESKMNKL